MDPNGVPYALGTIAPLLITTATPTFTATGQLYFPPSQASGLDKTGHFLVRIADNTALTPGGTTWNFTVCSFIGTEQPAFGTGSQCFNLAAPITISGSSQDITTQLNARALALTLPFSGAAGVTGSGTAGTLPVWLTTTSLSNSLISQTGTGATGNINYGAAFLNVNSADAGGISHFTCGSCTNFTFSTPSTGGGLGGTIQLVPPSGGGLGSSAQLGVANTGVGQSSAVLQADSNSHAGASASFIMPSVTFANLPTGSAFATGAVVYCNNCHTATTPCATSGGTGTGTFAFQVNGAWNCPF